MLVAVFAVSLFLIARVYEAATSESPRERPTDGALALYVAAVSVVCYWASAGGFEGDTSLLLLLIAAVTALAGEGLLRPIRRRGEHPGSLGSNAH